MRQADIFLESEADAWLLRNLGKIGKADAVCKTIEMAKIVPKYVLEVGCANGWRLNKLREKYQCGVMGIEPGQRACAQAALVNVPTIQGTAAALPVRARGYDMVIYAFCLYLTDPEDWFAIVREGDRVLAPGGHIVIHDFADESYGASSKPYSTRYEHRDGVMAYHFDFPRLWLSSPYYEQVIFRSGEGDDGVWILRKRSRAEALPVRP